MKKDRETAAIFDSPRNSAMIEKLRGQGADIIYLPEVRYVPVDCSPESKKLISSSPGFDWIVFSDPLTAATFLEEFERLGNDLFELDDVCIFSAGEAVADQLRFQQIHSDLIEPVFGIRPALDHIEQYLRVDTLKAITILYAGMDIGASFPKDPEFDQGVEVCRLELMRPSVPQIETARLRALIATGSVDRLLLGSVRDLLDLLAVFGTHEFIRGFPVEILEAHPDASDMLSLLLKSHTSD